MDHNRNFEDQELMRLLADLKAATPEYPRARLAKRRAAFLAGISAVAVGGVVATKIAALLKGSISQVDKVIIAAKVVAVTGLATYAVITAYIHRDELRDLVFPPPIATSISTEVPSVSPVIENEIPAATATPTLRPTGTASPTIPVSPTQTATIQPPTQAAPTAVPPTNPPPTDPPPPPTEPPPTNPGLHLGQTKTPRP